MSLSVLVNLKRILSIDIVYVLSIIHTFHEVCFSVSTPNEGGVNGAWDATESVLDQLWVSLRQLPLFVSPELGALFVEKMS